MLFDMEEYLIFVIQLTIVAFLLVMLFPVYSLLMRLWCMVRGHDSYIICETHFDSNMPTLWSPGFKPDPDRESYEVILGTHKCKRCCKEWDTTEIK